MVEECLRVIVTCNKVSKLKEGEILKILFALFFKLYKKLYK